MNPELSPQRWRALQDALDGALDLARPERAGYLARTLGHDDVLHGEAERLLAACERAERAVGLLGGTAPQFAAPLAANVPDTKPAVQAALARALAGRYDVQRELGRGGMASVWQAWDRRHERAVAIKVLDAGVAHASAERFLREIRTTARLTHPHILTLFDSGEADGLLYYVMPYVEGETLRARLQRERRLPLAEAVRLLRETADALVYAHARGVVHRDLKPENVLLSGGHAVVMDFGIAKALAASTIAAGSPAELTSFGLVIGTPGYMAPEQAANDPALDHRADLYALGVIGYELLTGAHPFAGVTGHALLRARLTQAPPPIAARRSDVPASVAQLVVRLLAPDPDERPQSAETVLQELERAQTLTTGSTAPAAEPSLFAELRRRKVFRVAAVYIGSAFVLLQGAELLISALHLSGWLLTLLVVLALAGLPLALVLAWAFDVVPDPLAEPSGRRSPLRWAVPILAVLVLAAATRLAWQKLAPHSESVRTLAVLPFENRSGGPEHEPFSDGMTDELVHALGRLPGLRLAGQASSYAFKGKAVSAQEVGRALAVGSIITGSVRHAGDRLRVSTQLVRTSDGVVLWDSIFESHAGDVFAVQDSLAKAMVAALTAALGIRDAEPVRVIAQQGTDDPEAWNLYQQGRSLWLVRGAANVAQAIRYYRQAIERDPQFARAWAGLASAYGVLPVYVAGSNDSSLAGLDQYARRALALDSTLADAHAVMGFAHERNFRLAEAERHYRTALRYEPWNVNAHHTLGGLLDAQGRTEESLQELRLAAQLEPLAKSVAASLSSALTAARRFDEARLEARRALALDSTFALAEAALADAQMFGGQPDSAIVTLERPIARGAPLPGLHSSLVYAYAAAGRWQDAWRARDELRHLDAGTRPVHMAFAELVFGNPEPAVRLLATREGQARWWWDLNGLGCNPRIDLLWSDARFRSAMRGLGIAPCPLARPWPLAAPGVRRP